MSLRKFDDTLMWSIGGLMDLPTTSHYTNSVRCGLLYYIKQRMMFYDRVKRFLEPSNFLQENFNQIS